MPTFYIFRHGETFVTKGLRTNYGTQIRSASILDEGKPALQKMGDYLKDIPTDFNASSQYRRCRQTVEIISHQSGKQFIFDKRLNEFFFEFPYFFRQRVKRFLNEIQKNKVDKPLICTHAIVINELIRLINPEAFKHLMKIDSTVRQPVQTEASRKDLQLNNRVTYTKYLSPAVLLILTENSVQEVNFNTPIL